MHADAATLARLADRLLTSAERKLQVGARLPGATYRVQLSRNLTFSQARDLVRYLDALGITDLYVSPIFAAQPGSPHGYDVVDYARLNPDLGTQADLEALAAELRSRHMGLVVDFVPNHMGIDVGNARWHEMLELGPHAPAARLFDIDWAPVKEELQGKLLLPVLGDQYGTVLERGELKLELTNLCSAPSRSARPHGALHIRYFDHIFPVAPRQYARVLGHRLATIVDALGPTHPAIQELQSVLFLLERLPTQRTAEPHDVEARRRETEVMKRRLAALIDASTEVRAFLEENVRLFNGTPGDPHSFDRLDQLLGAQVYRLAHWRVAAEEVNYRRFFDINGLAAIRVEDPEVFTEMHAALLALIRQNIVTGLRIDHPDGLQDPHGYFRRLQAHRAEIACAESMDAQRIDPERRPSLAPLLAERIAHQASRGSVSPLFRPLFVVAEKILAPKEPMPAWPIHGTTGYEFLNATAALFIEPSGARILNETYGRLLGHHVDFDELVYEKKKLIMSTTMASEINVLGRQLNRLSELDRRTRDFTLNALTRALVEVIACFPVYRTYVEAGSVPVESRDRACIQAAVTAAKRRNPAVAESIYDFVSGVLTKDHPPSLGAPERTARTSFALKFQQLTGPVTAKGVEDTAFYVFNRLVSLNEVGGDPRRLGLSTRAFHAANVERQMRWPHSLLATSTHDTKRSEDVRARISALTEFAPEWRRHIALWTRLNRRHKRRVHDRPAPDRNEEYLLYQTLIGIWPAPPGAPLDRTARTSLAERLRAYMQKATKEAKVNTSWVNPDSAYDQALAAFVDALFHGPDPFLASFGAFVGPIIRAGQYNALTQTLLKLTSPGVPDLYQGCELWDLSLVDPDNRRPVNFSRGAELLSKLEGAARDLAALCRDLSSDLDSGRLKLWLTARAWSASRVGRALSDGKVRRTRSDRATSSERGGAVAQRGNAPCDCRGTAVDARASRRRRTA